MSMRNDTLGLLTPPRPLAIACALVGLALTGGGCAGTTDGAAVGSASALGDAPRVVSARAVWEGAPAGCEGVLPSSGVTITGAFGAPELRVAFGGALGAAGEPLCADTATSLGTELERIGLVVQPVLADQPLQAVPAFVVHRSDEAAGDPSPQPSQPRRVGVALTRTTTGAAPEVGPGPTGGDPSPQPSARSGGSSTTTSMNGGTTNGGTTDGDPSPQPSEPTSPTHL